MFWKNKNKQIVAQEQFEHEQDAKIDGHISEDGDITVNFPITDDMVEAVDQLGGAREGNYAADSNIDAMAIVDSFLSQSSEEVKKAVREQVQENMDIGDSHEFEDTDVRLAYLSNVALHYYLSRYHNWAEAYFTAIDEVPAFCLVIPESPIEYASVADADEVAKELGYDSYSVMANECNKMFADYPFLKEVAESTLDFAKKRWFDDIATTSPAVYVQAVSSELRANWPGVRGNAGRFYDLVLNNDDIHDAHTTSEEGEEVVISGIRTLDDNFMPAGFAVCSVGDWDKLVESFHSYNAEKLKDMKEDGEHVIIPDDDVLSLTYLQAYQWTNRSWNKIDELLPAYLNDCFTFCWACLSEDFVIPDMELLQEHASELDEIAKSLMNEDGEVELRQVRPGPAGNPDLLDKESRRFVELADEQAQVERVGMANEGIVHVLGVMAGTKQTVSDLVIDEILSCVYAMADLTNASQQIRCMEEIRNATLEKVSKMSKSYKSKWKKYLSKDERAARAVKDNWLITDMDDNGDPIFVERIGEDETSENKVNDDLG